MRSAWRVLVFVALTLITQIGGIVYLLCLALTSFLLRTHSRWAFFLLFAGLYLLATALMPSAARLAGREPVACNLPGAVAPSSIAALPHACLLNRNFLRSDVAAELRAFAERFSARHGGSRLTVLETGFPFIDGFPLLPHLSHRDGRKIDLAYFYFERKSGMQVSSGSPSPIGFFVVEPPLAGDVLPCAGRFAPLRWSFWWLDRSERDWIVDETRTADLVALLAEHPAVDRILLEPHLIARLNVAHAKVRFQGCHAARHDDHIHVSFK